MKRTFAAILLVASACTVIEEDAGTETSASGTATSGSGGGATTTTTSSGTAGGGPVEPESCDPYHPRAVAPELIIGPKELGPKVIAAINAAQKSIDVSMYEFDAQTIIDALGAAQKRGVKVRVLLDMTQPGNDVTKSKLAALGVEAKASPKAFVYTHAKTMLIDGARAVVLSANFNGYSLGGERNYGVIDTAADDVADLAAIFATDWSGAPLDLKCTRLLVSPVNARSRILGLINGAKKSLDFTSMYITDSAVLSAIKARAAAGVPVRVLLADPAWMTQNTATAADLQKSGVATKFFKKLDLHAKLIVADGAAFVGSENLSFNSLDKNREVGVLVTETAPFAAIRAQVEADWAAGVP
jgi:cardiolipin synthase A/B